MKVSPRPSHLGAHGGAGAHQCLSCARDGSWGRSLCTWLLELTLWVTLKLGMFTVHHISLCVSFSLSLFFFFSSLFLPPSLPLPFFLSLSLSSSHFLYNYAVFLSDVSGVFETTWPAWLRLPGVTWTLLPACFEADLSQLVVGTCLPGDKAQTSESSF